MYPSAIVQHFVQTFHRQPSLLVCAPGRINLIGEHTDYNAGYVLPAAIDKAIYMAIGLNDSGHGRLVAFDFEQTSERFFLDDLRESPKKWPNYLIGVVSELQKAGFHPQGFDVVFGGDIPKGAGLSSSAALEAGLAFGLSKLHHWPIEPLELATIAKAAENNFVGVACGIMDQFASLLGKKNHVIKLDCRDLSYEYIPFEAPDYQLVLCNSGKDHALENSDYNNRTHECEQGVALLRGQFSTIESLRDVSMPMLEAGRHLLPERLYRRCRYVVGEKNRLLDACDALVAQDFARFGQRMFETHWGLSRDYEVSIEELDFLVEKAQQNPDVLGSRMMGGGFGGCTINLVKKEKAAEFIQQTEWQYTQHFGKKLICYQVAPSEGVHLLD
jgi:galactokinase